MAKKKELVIVARENGCHECTSHKRDSGYTRIKVNGKFKLLHRVVYEQTYGEIPDSLVIRHKCDNPACVNIEHLEVGTHDENMQDMVSRGRQNNGDQSGEGNGNSKLSEEQVREIKLDKTSTNVSLAKKYGVSHSLISLIRKGKVWSHI